MNIVLKLYF